MGERKRKKKDVGGKKEKKKNPILRGLNKGQKKEIYFCNKVQIFSSFSFFFCLY